MPIYDFRCDNCNKTTEKIVKTNTDVIVCPHCGNDARRQLSSPGGFQLKGGGFYKPSTS